MGPRADPPGGMLWAGSSGTAFEQVSGVIESAGPIPTHAPPPPRAEQAETARPAEACERASAARRYADHLEIESERAMRTRSEIALAVYSSAPRREQSERAAETPERPKAARLGDVSPVEERRERVEVVRRYEVALRLPRGSVLDVWG